MLIKWKRFALVAPVTRVNPIASVAVPAAINRQRPFDQCHTITGRRLSRHGDVGRSQLDILDTVPLVTTARKNSLVIVELAFQLPTHPPDPRASFLDNQTVIATFVAHFLKVADFVAERRPRFGTGNDYSSASYYRRAHGVRVGRTIAVAVDSVLLAIGYVPLELFHWLT